MLRYLCSLLFASLYLLPGSTPAQDTLAPLDRFYGLDQTLSNGKIYTSYPPYGTKGNQYLVSPEFVPGTVTIQRTVYSDIYLNYDIYNQELLLKVVEASGAQKFIEVSKAWLTGFSLGRKRFELLDVGKGLSIYQVLGTGNLRILYSWKKSMDLDIAVGSNNYVFTHAARTSYLLKDGILKSYASRGGLIRLFPKEQRKQLRGYLHKNHIRMRGASDDSIEAMIRFMSTRR